ncbi:hypothetical protein E4K10_29355 [Streptomyces sp. T1317-0309]|nr:hypothetical protein E4K10_29355 [Streptomyces sp. T1317-0309]
MCGCRSARRRGEVAPRRRLGTVLASPHSTNNLSATAPTSCRGVSRALSRTCTSLTTGQFRHSSTSVCAIPNTRKWTFHRLKAPDKTVIKSEPRQKRGFCERSDTDRTRRVVVPPISLSKRYEQRAGRVKRHSRLPHIYDNCRMVPTTCPTADAP